LKTFLTQLGPALPLTPDQPVKLRDDQKCGTTIKIAIWGAFLPKTNYFCHPPRIFPPSIPAGPTQCVSPKKTHTPSLLRKDSNISANACVFLCCRDTTSLPIREKLSTRAVTISQCTPLRFLVTSCERSKEPAATAANSCPHTLNSLRENFK
jgi:hypothetical protein